MRLIFWIWLLVFLTTAYAAPKTLSCLSYQENDGSMQEDDDIDEYTTSGDSSLELSVDSVYTAPHVRICPSDYTFCFSLWRQTQNGTQIEKQGCWKESTENEATCNQTECMSTQPTTGNISLYYCCCAGNMCNQKMIILKVAPLELADRAHATIDAAILQQNKNALQHNAWLMWSMFLIIVSILCALGLQVYNRNIHMKDLADDPAILDCSGPGYSSNIRNVDNINLVCMLGVGKYGTVMKGHMHDQEVAVKIYSEAHHQYYINERNIYTLPFMDCPSLLTYFGFDEHHTINGTKEYQLVLSLAPLGCLQDWLTANTMDFETLCGMVKSISRGLSHLHTEYRSGDKIKPCIAHRDLTSRNVLVKADRTCCIADFGFALKVFGARYEYKGVMAIAETKSISEVGTLRYMAPELLEGAVNLRDCETSLKQMDVYALGLVLWEVATRCKDLYYAPEQTPAYKAPYELELGLHPTFDQMQTLVARHKARPFFPEGWRYCNATKIIKETCEDCWDHDSEARLTSLCAEERMQELVGNWSANQSISFRNAMLKSKILNHKHVNINHTGRPNSNMEEPTIVLHPPPNQQLPITTPPAMAHDINQMQTETFLNQSHFIQPTSSTLQFELLNQRAQKQSFPNYTRRNSNNIATPQEREISPDYSSESIKILTHSSSYPKLINEHRHLRGWYKVRALIEKKIFNNNKLLDTMNITGLCDEKCNLVNGSKNILLLKGTTGNRIRPNNLDLDEQTTMQQTATVTSCAQIHENNSNSNSNSNSNNCNANGLRQTTRMTDNLAKTPLRQMLDLNNQPNASNRARESWDECQFRRQRSLEMFREVFVGQHNHQRLKDPSQRVKTPGDVPPSVRKMRASKTLSLYDDRMMEYGKYNDI